MRRLLLSILLASATCLAVSAQNPQKNEKKPYTRWWWMGSAVDSTNLALSLSQLSEAGIGGVEITPIYGVQGNEGNDIPFLSPRWMEMYSHTVKVADQVGIQVDMNTGTGWPFGGPEVTLEDAATHFFFREYGIPGGGRLSERIVLDQEDQRGIARLDRLMACRGSERLDITSKVNDGMLDWTAPEGDAWRLIALFVGKSLQEVNRAAPGGEGYVLDHYNAQAVRRYLDKFDKAFAQSGAPFPDTFFNDSYEVYGAEWTPGLLDEFEKRRGYKLEDFFPEFLDNGKGRSEVSSRVISDYRETLSDLLKENFTQQWTDWAHSHGVRTRNQAHGSPGNLIDLYAIVDIPECEGFGLSDFGIDGLRKDDPYTRKNDCDLSMLKYASSAAHISGKPLTSSETFTWLTEHFRTSLSQCKPDLDLMFVSGVNHVFYHGTCYSPQDDPWPGWKFYASVDMSPTNPQWNCIGDFDAYIKRCQTYLQSGRPDNDFLLYLPIYDIWHRQEGAYLPFEIDHMDTRAPEFIEVVTTIDRKGYDVDYISDDFIRTTGIDGKSLVTSGGASYNAIVLPSTEFIPTDVLSHLMELAREGATLVFIGRYPSSVPGLGSLEARQRAFDSVAASLPKADFGKTTVHPFGNGRIITGSDYSATLAACGAVCEEMKSSLGLHCIRRASDDGSIYFVSSLQKESFDGWVTLGRPSKSVQLIDPMTGRTGMAQVRNMDGKDQVRLQLKSGESVILCTGVSDPIAWKYLNPSENARVLPSRGWKMKFVQSDPAITRKFHLRTLKPWTELGEKELLENCGTALYEADFKVSEMDAEGEWVLHLGDVRESAKVWINGKNAGTAWAVPYDLRVTELLHKGVNHVKIEVTNLPANKIASFDRKGVQWRKFKNINTVNIHYEPSDYSDWAPVPSGLCSEVYLSLR